jgi:hypothetical protein
MEDKELRGIVEDLCSKNEGLEAVDVESKEREAFAKAKADSKEKQGEYTNKNLSVTSLLITRASNGFIVSITGDDCESGRDNIEATFVYPDREKLLKALTGWLDSGEKCGNGVLTAGDIRDKIFTSLIKSGVYEGSSQEDFNRDFDVVERVLKKELSGVVLFKKEYV